MATYNSSAVANAVIAYQKPITLQQGRALRDNPIAIAEGADGAPRVLLPALERLVAGDEIRSRVDGETATGHSFSFAQAGSIRVAFEHKDDGGVGTAYVKRTRNGSTSTVASFADTTSYVARTVDVGVKPGDTVTISIEDFGGATPLLRNQRFQTDGGNLWPGVAAKVEGNNV